MNVYARQACVWYCCAASGRNAITMRQLSPGASASGPPKTGHVHSFPHTFGVPSKNVPPNHIQMFESPATPPSPPPAAGKTVMSLTFVMTTLLHRWSPTATVPKFVCLKLEDLSAVCGDRARNRDPCREREQRDDCRNKALHQMISLPRFPGGIFPQVTDTDRSPRMLRPRACPVAGLVLPRGAVPSLTGRA